MGLYACSAAVAPVLGFKGELMVVVVVVVVGCWLVGWLEGGGGGKRGRRGGSVNECLCLCMSVWNESKKVVAKVKREERKERKRVR